MTWLTGAGRADITGEPVGVGMLGYGKSRQRTYGIHTRLLARAFAFEQTSAPAGRLLFVVAELPLIFSDLRAALLAELQTRLGPVYRDDQVLLVATHTHCAPSGYTDARLYNGPHGFRPRTFTAILNGLVQAAMQAHHALAPGPVTLGSAELHDASVNRARVAFERNPLAERKHFEAAIDPAVTVLRTPAAVIAFFATHGTSLTNRNRLISADNKGHAAAQLEAEHPGQVVAFAQTNAGDMSPNLGLRPGTGPTDQEFVNAAIIGRRQAQAARAALHGPAQDVVGPIDSRLVHVDLTHARAAAEFTGDGMEHRAGSAIGGASAFAGKWTDGRGFAGFREGRNPVFDLISRVVYRWRPDLFRAHSPKALVLPVGRVNAILPLVESRVPFGLHRLGELYLIAIPAEVTIVAGLRLRRTVASILEVELSQVLVAGYANGYLHYLTTPDEYDAQLYEGGSTLHGRWQLAAVQTIVADLAQAMREGRPVPTAPGTLPPAGAQPAPLEGWARRPWPGLRTLRGDRAPQVLEHPRQQAEAGSRVEAAVLAPPPAELSGPAFTVETLAHGQWTTIADDAAWNTRIRWVRGRAEMVWDVPAGVTPGRYRLRYLAGADVATAPFTVGPS